MRLDHNRLHSLHMDIFEHTTDLEILDLSYNPLVMLDKHTVIAIDSLPLLKVSITFKLLLKFTRWVYDELKF